MSSSPFRLSSVLSGHASDVRCLSSLSTQATPSLLALVSGSRDQCAKVWRTTPESKDLSWKEERCFVKHERYVSAVATVQPNERYPEGLIYTGTMGGVLRVFSPSSSNPLFELHDAHTDCIADIFVSKTGTVLTGSWDHSAKVWLEDLKALMTLRGHENSVWAVGILPESSLMVTASADKSFRIWMAGTCKKVVRDAHSQAIRDLCVLTQDTFLTCSNDGEIKRWKVDLETASVDLAQTIRAHNHFIYSVCSISNDPDHFAAVGESSGIKIFRNGQEVQSLPIPAISVWKVVCLDNGDIAAGSSDGNVWIFTADPRRFADESMNGIYELELSKFQRPAKTELEGIDPKDLPGPNALLREGKRDGQTLMVKDGDVISVHSWSQVEGKWTKIGDVVGQPESGANGAAADGGKVLYEGKEYDYVFDIELDAGNKLKLPYNKTEDSWQAAQKFIHKHMLPQDHLDTIANFIMRNTGGTSRVKTGGGSCDPFTGQGAYTTNGDSNGMEVDVANTFFPQTEFITFSQIPKFEGMIKKLKDFNSEMDGENKVQEDQLERLPMLCQQEMDSTTDDVVLLMKLLGWPQEKAFPALDILRLAVINPKVNQTLLNVGHAHTLIRLLKAYLVQNVPDNCLMLALRVLSNLFSVEEGLKLIRLDRIEIVDKIVALLPKENKNVQIAMTTVILNFAVDAVATYDMESQIQLVTNICLLFLEGITDPEAKFRVLVALGTVLNNDRDHVRLAKELQCESFLTTCTQGENVEKVLNCAKCIRQII